MPDHTRAASSKASGSAAPTVLQIIPNLDSGGAERTVVEVAEAIVRGGGRALVAANPGRLVAAIEERGGRLIPLETETKNPARIIANARAIERIVRDEGVSLLHARSRAPAWSTLIAARRARVPFVTTYHGAYGEKNAIKKLYNSVMVRSDVVIANSDWTAALVQTRYGTPSEKLVVIPRGIDPALFDRTKVSEERKSALRARWNLPEGAALVFVPARLSPRKGQVVVIDAVAELMKRGGTGKPFVVIFAGSAQGRTEYEAELDARIAAAGLTGVVRRVGHLDDVAAAYAIADLTIVPSIEPEAFGRTSAEAQASACPVATSDIGATPETIRAAGRVPAGEETGWVFRNVDAADLARVLGAALALDPAERAAIGARARAHAVSRYSLFNLQRDTLAVYDRLLGSELSRTFVARG